MCRLVFTLLVCLAGPAFAEAPGWVTTFASGSEPAGVTALADGSSVIAYTATPCALTGKQDEVPDFRNRMAIAKVNAAGKTVYDVEIPRPKEVLAMLRGPSTGVVGGITALSDGDLIVVAEFIEGYPWLIRLDGDSGGVRFSKFIGDTKGNTVIVSVAADGDDVVIGGGRESDMYVARYSGNGQKRWEQVVNAGGVEAVNALAVMSDGSVVATAMVQPAPGATYPQAIIIRLDKDGRTLGQRRFEGESPVLAVTRNSIGVAYEDLPPKKQTLRVKVLDTALAELAEVPFDGTFTAKRLVAQNDSFQLLYAGEDKIRMMSLSSRGKQQGDREVFAARFAIQMSAAVAGNSVYVAFIAGLETEDGKVCSKAHLVRIPLTTASSSWKGIR